MSRKERLVLVVAILASFVAFLDIAIVNVALPAIQRDLGGGLSSQQWVIDAYLVTLGSLILIAGSLSDLLGRKRILALGLAGFAVTSILCAIAPTAWFLIASRALQGIAGALLVPSSLAIVISTFSGPAQGKAIGTWTAWTGISFIIGPLVGGFLVDNASWRWIFAINIIPIAVTLWLMRSMLLTQDRPKDTPVDLLGAFLCALGLGGTVSALIEEPRYGWGDSVIYLPLAAGLLFFTAFLWREARTKHPMLPFSIFKNHNFSYGNIATTFIYAALTVSTFLITVFVQQVGGYSALKAGMSLLPVTILLFFLSPRIGGLAAKYGPRWFMTFGPIIAGLGFSLMLMVDSDIKYWTTLFPGVVIFGIGLSLTVAPLTSAILGDVEKTQSGIASAINNAVARVAGLIAIAAVGALVASQFSSHLQKGLESQKNNPTVQAAIDESKTKTFSIAPPASVSANHEFKDSLVDSSVSAFHWGIVTTVVMMGIGGLVSAFGIRNPQKVKEAVNG